MGEKEDRNVYNPISASDRVKRLFLTMRVVESVDDIVLDKCTGRRHSLKCQCKAYHCPLCSCKWTPGGAEEVMKQHVHKAHWLERITFRYPDSRSTYHVMKCYQDCKRNRRMWDNGLKPEPHFHCPSCNCMGNEKLMFLAHLKSCHPDVKLCRVHKAASSSAIKDKGPSKPVVEETVPESEPPSPALCEDEQSGSEYCPSEIDYLPDIVNARLNNPSDVPKGAKTQEDELEKPVEATENDNLSETEENMTDDSTNKQNNVRDTNSEPVDDTAVSASVEQEDCVEIKEESDLTKVDKSPQEPLKSPHSKKSPVTKTTRKPVFEMMAAMVDQHLIDLFPTNPEDYLADLCEKTGTTYSLLGKTCMIKGSSQAVLNAQKILSELQTDAEYEEFIEIEDEDSDDVVITDIAVISSDPVTSQKQGDRSSTGTKDPVVLSHGDQTRRSEVVPSSSNQSDSVEQTRECRSIEKQSDKKQEMYTKKKPGHSEEPNTLSPVSRAESDNVNLERKNQNDSATEKEKVVQPELNEIEDSDSGTQHSCFQNNLDSSEKERSGEKSTFVESLNLKTMQEAQDINQKAATKAREEFGVRILRSSPRKDNSTPTATCKNNATSNQAKSRISASLSADQQKETSVNSPSTKDVTMSRKSALKSSSTVKKTLSSCKKTVKFQLSNTPEKDTAGNDRHNMKSRSSQTFLTTGSPNKHSSLSDQCREGRATDHQAENTDIGADGVYADTCQVCTDDCSQSLLTKSVSEPEELALSAVDDATSSCHSELRDKLAASSRESLQGGSTASPRTVNEEKSEISKVTKLRKRKFRSTTRKSVENSQGEDEPGESDNRFSDAGSNLRVTEDICDYQKSDNFDKSSSEEDKSSGKIHGFRRKNRATRLDLLCNSNSFHEKKAKLTENSENAKTVAENSFSESCEDDESVKYVKEKDLRKGLKESKQSKGKSRKKSTNTAEAKYRTTSKDTASKDRLRKLSDRSDGKEVNPPETRPHKLDSSRHSLVPVEVLLTDETEKARKLSSPKRKEDLSSITKAERMKASLSLVNSKPTDADISQNSGGVRKATRQMFPQTELDHTQEVREKSEILPFQGRDLNKQSTKKIHGHGKEKSAGKREEKLSVNSGAKKTASNREEDVNVEVCEEQSKFSKKDRKYSKLKSSFLSKRSDPEHSSIDAEKVIKDKAQTLFSEESSRETDIDKNALGHRSHKHSPKKKKSSKRLTKGLPSKHLKKKSSKRRAKRHASKHLKKKSSKRHAKGHPPKGECEESVKESLNTDQEIGHGLCSYRITSCHWLKKYEDDDKHLHSHKHSTEETDYTIQSKGKTASPKSKEVEIISKEINETVGNEDGGRCTRQQSFPRRSPVHFTETSPHKSKMDTKPTDTLHSRSPEKIGHNIAEINENVDEARGRVTRQQSSSRRTPVKVTETSPQKYKRDPQRTDTEEGDMVHSRSPEKIEQNPQRASLKSTEKEMEINVKKFTETDAEETGGRLTRQQSASVKTSPQKSNIDAKVNGTEDKEKAQADRNDGTVEEITKDNGDETRGRVIRQETSRSTPVHSPQKSKMDAQMTDKEESDELHSCKSSQSETKITSPKSKEEDIAIISWKTSKTFGKETSIRLTGQQLALVETAPQRMIIDSRGIVIDEVPATYKSNAFVEGMINHSSYSTDDASLLLTLSESIPAHHRNPVVKIYPIGGDLNKISENASKMQGQKSDIVKKKSLIAEDVGVASEHFLEGELDKHSSTDAKIKSHCENLESTNDAGIPEPTENSNGYEHRIELQNKVNSFKQRNKAESSKDEPETNISDDEAVSYTEQKVSISGTDKKNTDIKADSKASSCKSPKRKSSLVKRASNRKRKLTDKSDTDAKSPEIVSADATDLAGSSSTVVSDCDIRMEDSRATLGSKREKQTAKSGQKKSYMLVNNTDLKIMKIKISPKDAQTISKVIRNSVSEKSGSALGDTVDKRQPREIHEQAEMEKSSETVEEVTVSNEAQPGSSEPATSDLMSGIEGKQEHTDENVAGEDEVEGEGIFDMEDEITGTASELPNLVDSLKKYLNSAMLKENMVKVKSKKGESETNRSNESVDSQTDRKAWIAEGDEINSDVTADSKARPRISSNREHSTVKKASSRKRKLAVNSDVKSEEIIKLHGDDSAVRSDESFADNGNIGMQDCCSPSGSKIRKRIRTKNTDCKMKKGPEDDMVEVICCSAEAVSSETSTDENILISGIVEPQEEIVAGENDVVVEGIYHMEDEPYVCEISNEMTETLPAVENATMNALSNVNDVLENHTELALYQKESQKVETPKKESGNAVPSNFVINTNEISHLEFHMNDDKVDPVENTSTTVMTSRVTLRGLLSTKLSPRKENEKTVSMLNSEKQVSSARNSATSQGVDIDSNTVHQLPAAVTGEKVAGDTSADSKDINAGDKSENTELLNIGRPLRRAASNNIFSIINTLLPKRRNKVSIFEQTKKSAESSQSGSNVAGYSTDYVKNSIGHPSYFVTVSGRRKKCSFFICNQPCPHINCKLSSTRGSETKQLMERKQMKTSCPKCTRRFNTISMLNQHLSSEHALDSPSRCENMTLKTEFCSICEKDITKSHFDFHMVSVHPSKVKEVLCSLCKFSTSNMKLLNSHMRKRHASEAFCCSMCKKVFLSEDDLESHIQKVHGTSQQTREQEQPPSDSLVANQAHTKSQKSIITDDNASGSDLTGSAADEVCPLCFVELSYHDRTQNDSVVCIHGLWIKFCCKECKFTTSSWRVLHEHQSTHQSK